jgi:hypothetical protein
MTTDPTNETAPLGSVLDGATPQWDLIPSDLAPVTEIAKDGRVPMFVEIG